MNILVDQQIRLFHELFSSLGETATYAGRDIPPDLLANADVLVTRSTVKVNQALLENAGVAFVGTCTIGTDHLDLGYLHDQQITWANAPACNADAVVQYVLSVMAQLSPEWMDATVGIIGCGNVGGRVYRRLRALGVSCRVYDPFLSAQTCEHLVSFTDVLQSDIITCHTPLTTSGDFPSYHLIDEMALAQLRPNALLINAGRGAVIDNQALLHHLSSNTSLRVALDVWEEEPNISPELMARVDIATPHIAGHSLEGKERGTVMVYEALCRYLEREPPVDIVAVVNTEKQRLPDHLFDNNVLANHQESSQTLFNQYLFNQLLLTVYPVMKDDARLREWLDYSVSPHSVSSKTTMAHHFDELRRTYPTRREYSHFYLPDQYRDSLIHQWLTILSQ